MALPLALSGEEVAFALLRRGFVLRARDDESMIVQKGLRRVVIPDTPKIEPEVLIAILREASVAWTDLLETLGTVRAVDNGKCESHIQQTGRHPKTAR